MYNGSDETVTVILCVCVTMSQEDMILSHVFLCVCVVSLITKLFCELKAFKPFCKRRFKLFPKWCTIVCNEYTLNMNSNNFLDNVYTVGENNHENHDDSSGNDSDRDQRRGRQPKEYD